MTRSRCAAEQVNGVLKGCQAGLGLAEPCREHGISPATFRHWRARRGGLEASEAPRPRSLEEENARLKQLLAGQMLNGAILKGMSGKKHRTPGSQQGVADRALERKGYAQRRACGLVRLWPRTDRSASRRADDAGLRYRLHALTAWRRWRYRRRHVLLTREGFRPGHKRLVCTRRQRHLGLGPERPRKTF
jgi:hypothetical protein